MCTMTNVTKSTSEFDGSGAPKLKIWLFELENALKLVSISRGLTDEQRVCYLISKVKGEALELLMGVERKKEDAGKLYDKYVQCLKEAYESTRDKYMAEDEFLKLELKQNESFSTFANRVNRLANVAFEEKTQVHKQYRVLEKVKQNVSSDYYDFVDVDSIEDLDDLIQSWKSTSQTQS